MEPDATNARAYGSAQQMIICTTLKGQTVLINPNQVWFVEAGAISKSKPTPRLFLKYDRAENGVSDTFLTVKGTFDSWLASLRQLRLNPGRPAVRLHPTWTQEDGGEVDFEQIIPEERTIRV